MAQSSMVTTQVAGSEPETQEVSAANINQHLRNLMGHNGNADYIVVISGLFARVFVFNYLGVWETATGVGNNPVQLALNNLATAVGSN